MAKADELRRKAKQRKIIIQTALIGLSVLVVVGAFMTARTNLNAQGLTSGFGLTQLMS